MNRALRLVAILAVGSCWFAGCGFGDRRPSPPRPSLFRRLKTLTVAPEDTAERLAVTAVKTARADYAFRLDVLQKYYHSVGNIHKLTWAKREMENLRETKKFKWEGVPAVLPPGRETLEQPDERLLVEDVVGARRDYKDAVAKLLAYYEQQGLVFKAKVIRNMQERLDPIRIYMYFLSAEIPPADLKTNQVIAEADDLYLRAWELHQSGRGVILFRIWANYKKQRQALAMLLELVEKYPRSTRASMAAYYIAEIYKEYFEENLRAVTWYERAWQWDGGIPKPARFQAAVIHDLRLYNTEEALRCYRLVVRDETFDKGNVDFALKRIKALGGATTGAPKPTSRPAP